jgi:sugar fermentation stimulation protein A
MSKIVSTLPWPRPIIKAKFLRRYKRFFADIQLDSGEIVVAHVPNSGSLKSCALPDRDCLITSHDDPNRKLKFTLEAIAGDGGWVGVNTSHPNALAEAAFRSQLFNRWHGWDSSAREVKISDRSRTDLVLWRAAEFSGERPTLDNIKDRKGPRFHFVEVKNVSMAEGRRSLFPDSVTERGLKHVLELVELIKLGHTAEFFFVIQRTDIDHFAPATEIDPAYSKALIAAHKQGLIVSPHIVELTVRGLHVQPKAVPFDSGTSKQKKSPL